MSRVHVVLFCNLIGTARARRRKSTSFPADVTRLSPPPSFSRREPGDEARGYATARPWIDHSIAANVKARVISSTTYTGLKKAVKCISEYSVNVL